MRILFQPIWPALFVSIVGTIAAYAWYENWGWWRGSYHDGIIDFLFVLVLGGMATCFGLALALAAARGLATLIGNETESIWRECWRAKLATLRSMDGVKGHISGGVFIMSGQIESRQVYYYYTDKGGGAYKPYKWFPDGDTTVLEEDRTDGEIVQFKTAFKDERMLWFGIPNSRLRMDFHIPRGSIRQQFAIE